MENSALLMALSTFATRFVRSIWTIAIFILVLIAVYVSLGRVMLPRIHQYHPQIERYVETHFGVELDVQGLRGDWQGFQPLLVLDQVRILPKDLAIPASVAGTSAPSSDVKPSTAPNATPNNRPGIKAGQIALKFDVFRSLLNWQPMFSSLVVKGAELSLVKAQSGAWQLDLGLNPTGSTPKVAEVTTLLLSQRHLELEDSSVRFVFNDGQEQRIFVSHWVFDSVDQFCASSGTLYFESPNAGDSSAENNLRAALNFSMNLQERDGEAVDVDLFVELEPLKIEHWLPLTGFRSPVSARFKRVHAGGKAWLTWRAGELVDLRGSVIVPVLEFASAEADIAPVTALQSEFVWQRDSGQADELWTLWLHDFNFTWQDEVFKSDQQRWSYTTAANSGEQTARYLSVVADAIDLELTSNTLLAVEQTPEKLKQALRQLKPEGRLVNAHFRYRVDQRLNQDNQSGSAAANKVTENTSEASPKPAPEFRLEANLKDIGVAPWRGAPGADGISGYLRVAPNDGEVVLLSSDLSLYFPKLYSHGWQFQQASGVVRWHNKGRALWFDSGDMKLVGATGHASGRFNLALPRDGAESRFDLLMNLRDAHVPPALTLVPDKRLDAGLLRWLNSALLEGQVNNATLAYSGPAVKSTALNRMSLQLDVDAESLTLSYDPNWPHLTNASAQVSVTEDTALVEVASAGLRGLTVQELSAQWRKGTGQVTVQTAAAGPLQDGLYLLRETPVRDGLFDLIDEFEVDGQIATKLRLAVPLEAHKPYQVSLSAEATSGEFRIPSLNLEFDNIDGEFSYSSNTGLSAKAITAQLFGQPLELSISSAQATESSGAASTAPAIEKTENTESIGNVGNVGNVESHENSNDKPPQLVTRLQLAGQLDTGQLYQWQSVPVFSRFSGVTSYRAVLTLGADDNKLVINTDLNGAAIAAPLPYGKTAEQNRPLRYEIELGEEQRHHLSYSNLVHYDLRYRDDHYHSGEIRFGLDPAEGDDALTAIRIRGALPSVDLGAWFEFAQELDKPASDVSGEDAGSNDIDSSEAGINIAEPVEPESWLSYINDIQVQVGELTYQHYQLDDLILQAGRIKSDWWLELENDRIKGRVNHYSNSDQAMLVELDYLRIPTAGDEGTDPLAGVRPQRLPKVDFVAEELWLGDDNFGRWSFQLRPKTDGALFQELQMLVRGTQVTGELQWLYQDSVHRSQFNGKAVTPDIGVAIKAWGYPDSVEGKDADLRGDLHWQGSPAEFALVNFEGNLRLKTDQGRFTDLESLPRIFGLFNFSSVARRVRLDFSDVFQKGFSYDKIRGNLVFDKGIATTSDSMVIDGPSGKFIIDGKTDLINEQLDQEVIVVLPLSDIPIAAAIVGAPQVGIPLWLINRAFGNMFERFTSARYTVKGHWSDPQIELVKVFENRNTGSAEQPEGDSSALPESAAPEPVPESRPSQIAPVTVPASAAGSE